MSVAAYRYAMRLLETFPNPVTRVKGATPEQISELGRLLGLELPASYRAFLSDQGILMFGAHMISGIGLSGVQGSSQGSVHWATMHERAAGRLSRDMIYLMPAGYGPDFVIDVSKPGAGGEGAVYEIHPEGFEHGMDKLAESFGEFLLDEVKRALEPDEE